MQLQTLDQDILKLTDEGIERAVLACLMKEHSKMIQCSTRLAPEDFMSQNNRYLYEIFLAMFKKNGAKASFDLSSIISIAESTGSKDKFIERSGGEDYIEFLSAMKNSMIDIYKFNVYVDRLNELSTKRKLLSSLGSFKDEIVNSSLSTSELAVKERNKIDAILLASNSGDLELKNLALGAADQVQKAMTIKKDMIGIPTGFHTLDKKLEGLKRGTLTVIAAPRKTGKSAFLMNIGINVGIKNKVPTLMISTEMSDEEIMWRIIANLSQISQNKIIKGDLTPAEKQRVDAAVVEFSKGQFYHITMRGFSLEKIIGSVRKFTASIVGEDATGQVNDCLILFDYIKMPQADVKNLKDLKEHKALGLITDGLKALAGDLNIPMVTACQTNRMGDIANSYEITWFCDAFLELLKKTDKEMNMDAANDTFLGNQKIKISANRSGEEDHKGINLQFDGMTLTYLDCGDK